jgi:hypothetical protein
MIVNFLKQESISSFYHIGNKFAHTYVHLYTQITVASLLGNFHILACMQIRLLFSNVFLASFQYLQAE